MCNVQPVVQCILECQACTVLLCSLQYSVSSLHCANVQCNIGVAMCNSTLRGCHRLHSSTSALPSPAPVAIILSLPFHHHQLPYYFGQFSLPSHNYHGNFKVIPLWPCSQPPLQYALLPHRECFITHRCLNPIIFWTVFCSSSSYLSPLKIN